MLAVTLNRTPGQGEVYRSPSGRPALYVRTENRPGPDGPAHLFVETADRIVLERWVPADGPLPEAWELTLDSRGVELRAELEGEVVQLTAERDALAEAMSAAVGSLPVPVANELRGRYKAALREGLHEVRRRREARSR